jgi:hypothetical protein
MFVMKLPFVKGDEDVRFDLVVVVVSFCGFNDATNTSLATGAHVEQEVGPNCDGSLEGHREEGSLLVVWLMHND